MKDRKVLKDGDINLRKLRPTEMKQNTRIIPPMEATVTSEAAIITQEDAVRRCIADYYSNCGDQSVLTEKELKGQKLISARVRKKEILVTYTDKDGRVVLCKPETYRRAAMVHISKDQPCEWSEVEKVTSLMNRTARQLLKVFEVGKDGSNGSRDRIVKASVTNDTNPPPVSFLWKTHKVYTEEPPTRPVCDASMGPISRTSEILTKILNPLIKVRDNPDDCDSTEGMLRAMGTLMIN